VRIWHENLLLCSEDLPLPPLLHSLSISFLLNFAFQTVVQYTAVMQLAYLYDIFEQLNKLSRNSNVIKFVDALKAFKS